MYHAINFVSFLAETHCNKCVYSFNKSMSEFAQTYTTDTNYWQTVKHNQTDSVRSGALRVWPQSPCVSCSSCQQTLK